MRVLLLSKADGVDGLGTPKWACDAYSIDYRHPATIDDVRGVYCCEADVQPAAAAALALDPLVRLIDITSVPVETPIAGFSGTQMDRIYEIAAWLGFSRSISSAINLDDALLDDLLCYLRGKLQRSLMPSAQV